MCKKSTLRNIAKAAKLSPYEAEMVASALKGDGENVNTETGLSVVSICSIHHMGDNLRKYALLFSGAVFVLAVLVASASVRSCVALEHSVAAAGSGSSVSSASGISINTGEGSSSVEKRTEIPVNVNTEVGK